MYENDEEVISYDTDKCNISPEEYNINIQYKIKKI